MSADVVCVHAKGEVEAFCRQDPALYAYLLGDLDDFFWPHTTWYALRDGGRMQQLALLYTGCTMPTLLAYAGPAAVMRELLRGLMPLLPRRFYAHLSGEAADELATDYRVHSHGAFHKMGLTDRSRLDGLADPQAALLTVADTNELVALYAASYPGNWFMPRMLETGCYYGIRRGRDLVCVAGVHVYSQTYRVAALGNITTRPDVRGQSLAKAATARLCQELLRGGIESIGLNVKADNRTAIACYERLGFTRIGDYGEYTVELR